MTVDIVLLGFLVPDDDFDRDSREDLYPQIAARNFECGFFEGFLSNKLSVQILASTPASTYPLNKKIIFRGRESKIDSSSCVSMGYVNLPGLKGLTRFTSALINLRRIFSWHHGSTKALCIYSLHSPYLLAANLMNRFYGVKYFVIVPDLPQFMSLGLKRGLVFRVLKKLDYSFIRFLLRRASGASIVAPAMLESMLELRAIPSVVIEGISVGLTPSTPKQELKSGSQSNRPYFLYAGGLNEAYGVGSLLRTFCQSNLDAELWFFGKGPLSHEIELAALQDERIRYFGFISQDILVGYLAGATALLMTRSLKDNFVRFSFPSKLLIYMRSGAPVLSTRLPGIPEEYFKYLTEISDDPDQLIGSLHDHLLRSQDDRKDQARKAFEFIANAKNPHAQVAKLIHLIYGQVDCKTLRKRGEI
ncbi:glycosyltransferase [Polynucleobacter sp. 71A-WALBACH]|uniref:glycosyltransferase n=1 Tax=Polynucleobacter sp. 71A-WALBACH TaxID=2689097 RepID=UPI001C0B8D9F|nr:glycosyltransferase [Polynucleobacter sp. 71A-WALBACH]MBU3593282.1 glycosyltransferase [Polynucleobacter sp. 71A-WALBACH]